MASSQTWYCVAGAMDGAMHNLLCLPDALSAVKAAIKGRGRKLLDEKWFVLSPIVCEGLECQI